MRSYPDHDVAANLVGFMGTDGPLAGLELAFNRQLAGTAGSETYEVGAGNRIPLGESTVVTDPVNGKDLKTTIDRGPAVVHPAGAASDRARGPG